MTNGAVRRGHSEKHCQKKKKKTAKRDDGLGKVKPSRTKPMGDPFSTHNTRNWKRGDVGTNSALGAGGRGNERFVTKNKNPGGGTSSYGHIRSEMKRWGGKKKKNVKF